MELEYREKQKTRWSHSATIDMQGDSPGGRSPREQFDDLRTAVELGTLVELTFKDGEAAYVYYVDVMNVQGVEETGADYTSEVSIVMVEG